MLQKQTVYWCSEQSQLTTIIGKKLEIERHLDNMY